MNESNKPILGVDDHETGRDTAAGAIRAGGSHGIEAGTEQVALEVRQWQSTFNAISDAICLLDLEGRILRFNTGFQNITGCDDNTLAGRFCYDAVHHTLSFIDNCPFFRARKTGKSEESEIQVDDRWYRIKVDPVTDARGETTHFVHVMIDITDRKMSATTLHQERELYRDLMNTMPAGIYRLRFKPAKIREEENKSSVGGPHYCVDIVNDRFCEITRISREEVINNPNMVCDRIHPEDRSDFILKNTQAIASLSSFHWEGRMLLPDQQSIWVYFESTPRTLENEETIWTGILFDISERKQAEQELLASEKRYHELFQINPHPMWIYDMETLRFLEVNNAAIAHYHYSRDEFLAMTIKDIRPAADVPRLLEHLTRISNGINNAGVWRHQKKDGSIIDVEISSHTLLYNDRPAEMIMVNDITEQLRTQSKSEHLLAAIEQANESILITDSQGRILYTNPVLERISGFSIEEILGKAPNIFKSGEQGTAFYKDLWRTISSGSVWRGRFVNRRKDGTLYTEAATISPVRNATGEIVNYVAVKRDITENLQLYAQLQQAQKMESVGRLAGGVAHDFNNMLSVILGYAQLALDSVDPLSSLYRDLQQIFDAAQRSTNITRQLLAFARKQIISPQILDLNTAVESMLKMLRRLIGEDVNLTWHPQPNLWPVKLDPSQIDQLLANLCVNARDAITGVGTITIETGQATVDAAYCVHHVEAVPGEYVLLSVRDNGCGMEKEILDNIFEPFFTTKGLGQGTGLGLATVYGIVKQNNGFINVSSEPGAGTTFSIYLPRHTLQPAELERESTGPIPRGQGETVLVVEDEAAILELTGRILADLGYTVLTASSTADAISLAHQQTTGVHLLLADVIMPEMNGKDLAELLRTLIPGLKCLFMSGYTADVIASQGGLGKEDPYIQKPFSIQTLSEKVREALVS